MEDPEPDFNSSSLPQLRWNEVDKLPKSTFQVMVSISHLLLSILQTIDRKTFTNSIDLYDLEQVKKSFKLYLRRELAHGRPITASYYSLRHRPQLQSFCRSNNVAWSNFVYHFRQHVIPRQVLKRTDPP